MPVRGSALTLSLNTIAVVDDHPSLRNAIRRLLAASGMEVETFASGEDALQAIARRPRHGLIIDLQMPGMTGAEWMAILHEAGGALPTVSS
jgi:FixJ family two-component response regulator